MFRIGIDVGGTFTDLVCVDAEGQVTLATVATTAADQSLGVIDGLRRLAEAVGLALGRGGEGRAPHHGLASPHSGMAAGARGRSLHFARSIAEAAGVTATPPP